MIRKVLAAELPSTVIVNINFPDCEPEEVAGVVVARQGKRNQDLLRVDARNDGRGNPYYWLAYERGAVNDPPEDGTDLAALAARYVSVTPLRLDLTHDAMMERLGKTHPDMGESWGNLAELLFDAGRFAEAERAYRETLAVYSATMPPGHVYISGTLIGLGGSLTELGRAAEAEPMLREAVALRIDTFGAGDRRTAKGQRMLGLCLAALGQRAEAERILLDSYRTLSEAKNWYHRTLGNAVLEDLVRLYRSWGEMQEAEKLEALLRTRR